MEVSLDAFKKRYRYDTETDLINMTGSFKLYKAWDNEQEKYVAIKIYTVEAGSDYSLKDEVMRAKKLKHPNLLEYFENYEIDTSSDNSYSGGQLQIAIMELSTDGTLSTFLNQRRLSVTELKSLAQNMVDGLAYLHSNNVAHRHINQKNILVFSFPDKVGFKINHLEISNDEKSTAVSETEMKYLPPEFFSAATHTRHQLTTAADVWSLGVVVYEALQKQAPFGDILQDTRKEDLINNILFKDTAEVLKSIGPPFREFLGKCFVRNPQNRPATAGALRDLFPDFSNEKVKNKKTLIVADEVSEKEKQTPTSREKSFLLPNDIGAKEKKTIISKEKIIPDEPTETEVKVKATAQNMLVITEENAILEDKSKKNDGAYLHPKLRKKYIVGSLLGIASIFIVLVIIHFVSVSMSDKKAKTDSHVSPNLQSTTTPVQTEVLPVAVTETPSSVDPQPQVVEETPATKKDEPPTKKNKPTAIGTSVSTNEAQTPTPAEKSGTKAAAFCFITLSAYYKPEGQPAEVNSKDKTGYKQYHFWSNVVGLNCNNSKTKDAVLNFAKAAFTTGRDDFDSFKDIKVHIYKTLADANKYELPYRDNSKYPDGNYEFDLGEEAVNKAVCK